MQFEIQAASVTNWLLILVAPPKGCDSCLTICTCHTRPSVGLLRNIPGRLGERSVSIVVLVVEAASVAQVVACFVPPPKRGRGGATINAFFRCCASGLWLRL